MNKNEKLINTIFIISLAVILLALTAVVLIEIFNPFGVKKISQLPDTTISQCLTKEKDSKYYVLIYDPNDTDNENIKSVLIEYYQAQKKNESLNSLYVIDYTKESAESVKAIVSDVESVENLPYMFIVSSGTVSTKYNTSSKICNALVEAMEK